MNPVSPHDVVFLQSKWPSANFFDESLETVAGRRRDELLAGGAIALRHGRLISTALDAGQSKSGRLSS